jgi:N-acetylneuraminic acid mutarotase
MIPLSEAGYTLAKNSTMRTVNAYIIGFALISFSVIFGVRCGSKGNSTTLIGDWSRSSDFDGDGRSEAIGFTIGDKTYLGTGTTDRAKYQDLWVFDLTKQFWQQLANLPGVARQSASAFAIGNFGYVASGFDGINYLNDVWKYDITANTWSQKNNFPTNMTARYDAVGFAINGKGYISTGYNGGWLKDLWQYDPGSDTWTQKASIGGSKRSAATVFMVNNQAYVVSGANNGSSLNDLWVYDPATDTWTQKRQISNVSTDTYDDQYTTIARNNAVTFTMNGLIYLASGENGALQTDTWEYNPQTDLWTKKTPFEGAARTGAIGFSLSNRGFVVTGRSGSLSFDNMYEFHPNDQVNANNN